MMHPAWIGLGSNLGESKKTLQLAWKKLGETRKISLLRLSSPWKTAPVAMESVYWFTNAVGKISTALSAEELLATLLRIEAQFGRHRSSEATGYQDRTLDLDLLYFGENGETQHSSPSLCLPHPEISKRLFVLQPLHEIEPKLYDLSVHKNIREMLSTLQDSVEGEKQQIEVDHW